jgi:acetylornithine deacetylase/succinyl-diaminopimelate desuccinylase-like protein
MSIPQQVLDLAIEIQQIPAPSFDEEDRSNFIRDRFLSEDLHQVEKDNLGNVYGCLKGDRLVQPIIITAHIDTVFPFETDLSISKGEKTIHGPGIGDNSLGAAGLFGLLWELRKGNATLPGDLWLVANVCEEGLGDLKGMRAVVNRFGDGPLAYIILEGMALGQVFNRGLGVQRYKITARGSGGHSWVDYGKPSAIHELAEFVTKINSLELPKKPRTSLNVGVISGGTSVNTIAPEASLQLDLRSSGSSTLSTLVHQVETLVSESNQPEISFSAEIIGQRPAGEITDDHPLVQHAVNVLESHGIKPELNIGSTDANIPLSQGIPAVCIGLTKGGGAHTNDEYIQTEHLTTGLGQLVDLVTRVFQSAL